MHLVVNVALKVLRYIHNRNHPHAQLLVPEFVGRVKLASSGGKY